VTPRRWLLLAGPVVVLAALGGLWQSARRTERQALDQANAALARSAAGYLSVVVPAGPANGYDPARLLSSAFNLARASFWPGGLQLALGTVPILPDTIGLIPVPDSLVRLLDQGQEVVIAEHARRRVALAPFLDKNRYGMLGWTAAWDTMSPMAATPSSIVLTLLAGLFLAVTGFLQLRGGPGRPLLLASLAVMTSAAALALNLNREVRQATRLVAEIRLATTKRLIEVAATAPGVRQAMLPEIAVGVRVKPLNGTNGPSDPRWGEELGAPVLTAIAATPRTAGALELTLTPDRDSPSRLRTFLLTWLGVLLLGLGLTGAARLTGQYSIDMQRHRIQAWGAE